MSDNQQGEIDLHAINLKEDEALAQGTQAASYSGVDGSQTDM